MKKYIRVHAESMTGLLYRGESGAVFKDSKYDYVLLGPDPIFPKTLILRRRSWIEKLLRIG